MKKFYFVNVDCGVLLPDGTTAPLGAEIELDEAYAEKFLAVGRLLPLVVAETEAEPPEVSTETRGTTGGK